VVILSQKKEEIRTKTVKSLGACHENKEDRSSLVVASIIQRCLRLLRSQPIRCVKVKKKIYSDCVFTNKSRLQSDLAKNLSASQLLIIKTIP